MMGVKLSGILVICILFPLISINGERGVDLSTSIYNDELQPVIGELGKSLGSIEGVSIHTRYNDSILPKIFKDNLFYKVGFGLDSAFGKAVKNKQHEYKLYQFRYDLMGLIGLNFCVDKIQCIYLGSGLDWTNYSLDIEIEDTDFNELSKQNYSASGIGRLDVIGLSYKINKTFTAFIEINWFDSNLKGKYKDELQELEIFMNPQFRRVYFGAMYSF